MSLTRDQLRAARVLLHLQQIQLAEIARVGVSTLRRFECGGEIGPLYLDALSRAIVDAGAVLIGGSDGDAVSPGVVGVALLPESELPPTTRARIAAAHAAGVPSDGAGKMQKPSAAASEKVPGEQPSTDASREQRVTYETSGTEAQRVTASKPIKAKAKAPRGEAQPSVEPSGREMPGDDAPVTTDPQGVANGPSPAKGRSKAKARNGGARSSGEPSGPAVVSDQTPATADRQGAASGPTKTKGVSRAKARGGEGRPSGEPSRLGVVSDETPVTTDPRGATSAPASTKAKSKGRARAAADPAKA